MSASRTVLVVTENLFFLPRIQIAATAAGMTSRQTGSKAAFDEAYRAGDTAFVLIDLEADRDTWRDVLTAIKAAPGASPKMIAYGPHTAVELMAEAQELGCEAALPKGAFVNQLPGLFQTAEDSD